MNQTKKDRLRTLREEWRACKGNNFPAEKRQEMVALADEQKQEDAARFGDGIRWLTQGLYLQDPIGLVNCGVPEDEYELEARLILRRLAESGNPSFTEITSIVYDVFSEMFGGSDTAGSIEKSCYPAIAKELLLASEYWHNK